MSGHTILTHSLTVRAVHYPDYLTSHCHNSCWFGTRFIQYTCSVVVIVTFLATFLHNWPSFSSQCLQYLSEPNPLDLKMEKICSSKMTLLVCDHRWFQNLEYYHLNTNPSMKIWKPWFRMEIYFYVGLNLQLPLMQVWCEFSCVGFKDIIADMLYQIVICDHDIRYSIGLMLLMFYFLLSSSG